MEKKQITLMVPNLDYGRIWRFVQRWLLPNPGTLVLVVVLLLTLPTLAGPLAQASTPSISTIPYQGRLADASGIPVTGKQNMEFRLYDVPVDGTPLWVEYWTGASSVDVSDGLFSVMLGSLNTDLASVVQSHTTLFLGITVDIDKEMTPRVQLGSVPFSIWSLTVADNSITSAKIADGSVTGAKIADGTVGSPDIGGDAITSSHIQDGTVELSDMGLAKYQFMGGGATAPSLLRYTGPSGIETTLDTSTCVSGQWCCNNDKSICYTYNGVDDSTLQFTLEGAPSITCNLLHYEDDSPAKLYYATDSGGSCQSGKACAILRNEGVTGQTIHSSQIFSWLCGW